MFVLFAWLSFHQFMQVLSQSLQAVAQVEIQKMQLHNVKVHSHKKQVHKSLHDYNYLVAKNPVLWLVQTMRKFYLPLLPLIIIIIKNTNCHTTLLHEYSLETKYTVILHNYQ